ncbi:MucR family transcriptional regulator [Acidimangrovimonas pyrenivorans]|uniref:MucR family transcriptional regulator n=1 Tax=Acidimangrovimonas pyrenivorans TaxID=2030798 RepID=A0ABV7AM65_9RHOB
MTAAQVPSNGRDTAALQERIVALVSHQAEQNAMSLAETLRLALQLHEQMRAPRAERPAPAVPVTESVRQDFLICLETGAKLKMLRRHLQDNLGMTPEEYRRKWQLPDDYPMTAPSYSAAKARARQATSPDRHRRGASRTARG